MIVGPTVEFTTIKSVFLDIAASATSVGKSVPYTSEETSGIVQANTARP